MDRYLIDKYVVETDDQLYNLLSSYFVAEAKDKFDIDGMTFYNYYANDGYSLQFVVDVKKDGDSLSKEGLCIHHTSPSVWNMKIVTRARAKNTYVVTTDDDEQMAVMRFVNHSASGKQFKEGDKVKAQVVGFVLDGNIYENEEAYKKASKDNGTRIGENRMLPLRMLVNNSSKKPKSERDATLPAEDRIMAANFTVKSCHKIPLHIFEHDRPAYYAMEVETAYGDMHLFFTMDSLDKPIKQFKKGDIFVGNIMLSGDVYFAENNVCHHAKTKKELGSIMDQLGLIGLSIKNMDTPGVIEDISTKKRRVTEGKFGFCTDLPMFFDLSDGRTISINAPSFKDVYEGFTVTVNPKPIERDGHTDLDVAGYCKECLGKKITGYEITKYGEDIPEDTKGITPESPEKLIIKLEDGTKMTFGHWLGAEYMDFDVQLPKK